MATMQMLNGAINLLESNCRLRNCRNRHIACIFLSGKFKRRSVGRYDGFFYGINNVSINYHHSEHAEVNALRKLPPRRNNRLICIDIFVIRVSITRMIGMSKPCIDCLKYMSKLKGYKIKNIYYSNGIGTEIVCETFTQLVHDEHHHKCRHF